MTRDDFFKEAERALGIFDSFGKDKELVPFVAIDHLNFRCATVEEFDELRSIFEREERFFYQALIANRRMALIGLKQFLPSVFGAVKYIELADQKPDGSQSKGFEHIEVCPKGVSYEEMIASAQAAGLVITEKVRPYHTTHDIEIGNGFTFRFSNEPLIEKIKREEFI